MMFFRLVLAIAVLFPVLVWRLGAREAARRVRGHRLGGRSPSASSTRRSRSSSSPGARSTSTRAWPRSPTRRCRSSSRCSRSGSARASACPACGSRGSSSGSSASACSPGSTRRAAGGRSPGRSRSSSPRSPMRARTTSSSTLRRPRRRSSIATATCATGAVILLPVRARPAAGRRCRAGRRSRSVAALGVIGTAFALLFFYRMLNTLRVVAHVARHVPAAAGRALLRRLRSSTSRSRSTPRSGSCSSSPASRSGRGGARLLRRGARRAEPEPATPAGMSEPLVGEGFRVRRATAEDIEFMADLAGHDEVEPFMAAVSVREPDALLDEVRRSEEEPAAPRPLRHRGRGRAGRRDGVRRREPPQPDRLPRTRSCSIPASAAAASPTQATRLLVAPPRLRARLPPGPARGLRLQRARRAPLESAGFVREGVRRQAYWRHGEWVDGVLFGLVREDLQVA